MPEPDRQKILFVDDEAPMRHAVAQWLGVAGYDVETFETGAPAAARLTPSFPGIVVSDLRMPGIDGMGLLRKALAIDPDLPVILITGQGDIESAVEAMRLGAYDFLEKPFAPDRFAETVHRASEKRRLVLENRRLRGAGAGKDLENRILGTSRAIQRVREALADIAATDVSVILYGETGTGKDLVARCLHDLSRRARGNYVAVNCAAVPETMVESEFFGHEAGAFTGAVRPRPGRLEHAGGGTLFLDEIESMPLPMQAKLLRVLQERTVERLGSNASIPLDIRTIAAAKRDLKEASQAGAFRADLYFRLSVVELSIPPLRQRPEDIPLLFEFFAARAAESHGREPRALRPAARDALLDHPWPGNVRELRNVAERHALGLGGASLSGAGSEPEAPEPLSRQVEAFERRAIERALAQAGGRISVAMQARAAPSTRRWRAWASTAPASPPMSNNPPKPRPRPATSCRQSGISFCACCFIALS